MLQQILCKFSFSSPFPKIHQQKKNILIYISHTYTDNYCVNIWTKSCGYFFFNFHICSIYFYLFLCFWYLFLVICFWCFFYLIYSVFIMYFAYFFVCFVLKLFLLCVHLTLCAITEEIWIILLLSLMLKLYIWWYQVTMLVLWILEKKLDDPWASLTEILTFSLSRCWRMYKELFVSQPYTALEKGLFLGKRWSVNHVSNHTLISSIYMLVYTYIGIFFFQFQTVKIVVLSKPEPRIIKSAFGQNGRTTKYFADVIIREDTTPHKVSTFKRELAEKLKVEKCYKTLKCTHHQMYGYEIKGDSVACFLEPLYKIRFINISQQFVVSWLKKWLKLIFCYKDNSGYVKKN